MSINKDEKTRFQEIVGKNIEKYRLKRGLSREELAERGQLDVIYSRNRK